MLQQQCLVEHASQHRIEQTRRSHVALLTQFSIHAHSCTTSTAMSPTLTLETRLILACARTDADVPRIAELVALGPDWDAFLRQAERWRVVPLIDAQLRHLEGVPAE